MYTNIENIRMELLESLGFGSMIEKLAPISMKGSQFKHRLVEGFNKESYTKIKNISESLLSAVKFRENDNAVDVFLTEASNKFKDLGIKSSLVYSFEIIESLRSESQITLGALKTLDSLVVKESNEIVESIRSGALNAYRSLPTIENVIGLTKIVESDKYDGVDYEINTPISYIEETSNANCFRIGNYVFAINENGVARVNSPSAKFTYLSGIVESLIKEGESFKAISEDLGTFILSENKVELVKEGEEAVELDLQKYIKEQSMVMEAKQDRLTEAKKEKTRGFIDAIVALKENFNSLAILDNVKVVKNKRLNESFIFVVNENNYNILSVDSKRYVNLNESYDRISEAIKRFETITNVNLNKSYIGLLAEEVKQDETKEALISEQQEILQGLVDKSNSIKEAISVSKNADKIKALQEALELTSKFIDEQTDQLNTLLSK